MLDPGDGSRAIFVEQRKGDLGIQPIVGKHRDDTPLCQGVANEAIFGLSSGNPRTAIPEDNHRQILARKGCNDVELLPGALAIRQIQVPLDIGECRRCIGREKHYCPTSRDEKARGRCENPTFSRRHGFSPDKRDPAAKPLICIHSVSYMGSQPFERASWGRLDLQTFRHMV